MRDSRTVANNAPHLVDEWHPTKNGGLSIHDFAFGSAKRVWWQCSLGHEWESIFHTRTKMGQGCPFCAGKRILAGFNDLATTNTGLANEWHPTKNLNLTPQQVSAGMQTKVWWQCAQGHEWEAVIQSRHRGNGCPYCSGNKAIQGVNDLATLHPLLVGEWHPDNSLLPSEVSSRSQKKIKWQCSKDAEHTWSTTVVNRTAKGSGCPICYKQGRNGYQITKTVADDPYLLAEWHPTKNSHSPDQITLGSGRKVWWKCLQGHEWEAKVSNRVRGSKCHACNTRTRTVAHGNTALSEIPEYAHLVKEWHSDNNVSPAEVSPGQDIKVMWQCQVDTNHTWRTTIGARTKNGTGCPECAGRRNDGTHYVSEYPELVKEWHPDNTLTPDEVTDGSGKKIRWQCRNDLRHVWEMAPCRRTGEGLGCPLCSGNRIISGVNDLASNADYGSFLSSEWHPTKNDGLTPQQVSVRSNKKVWWQCSTDSTHEWQAVVYSRTRQNGGAACPTCAAARSVSKAEEELLEQLQAWGFEVQTSVRHLLPKREIDLYVPSLKLGIEFNGLYWHSTAIRPDVEYHQNKQRLARAAGIELIEVWEDDWRDRKDLVLRFLSERLGVVTKKSLPVESLRLVRIDSVTALRFFKENSLFLADSIPSDTPFYGLVEATAAPVSDDTALPSQEDLLAVYALHSGASGFAITVFADNGDIDSASGISLLQVLTGSAVKMLVDPTFQPVAALERLGMQLSGWTSPERTLLMKGQRVSVRNVTVIDFATNPNFVFEQDKSLEELIDMNAVHSVYDSGREIWEQK